MLLIWWQFNLLGHKINPQAPWSIDYIWIPDHTNLIDRRKRLPLAISTWLLLVTGHLAFQLLSGQSVTDRMLDDGGLEELDPTPPRILSTVAFILEKLVSRNDLLIEEVERCSSSSPISQVLVVLEAFRAPRVPSISIGKYLGRIYKYTGCSPSCFVVAFVYVDRLLYKYPGFLVVSFNVHRLMLSAVLIASKVLETMWVILCPYS